MTGIDPRGSTDEDNPSSPNESSDQISNKVHTESQNIRKSTGMKNPPHPGDKNELAKIFRFCADVTVYEFKNEDPVTKVSYDISLISPSLQIQRTNKQNNDEFLTSILKTKRRNPIFL